MSIVQDRPTASSMTHAADLLIEAVYGLILVVTVATWSLVGFAVWVPLLIRSTTVLAGTVFYASLFRDQARLVNAQRAVDSAIRFYVRGFGHFIAFYRQRHEPEMPVGFLEPLSDMKWRELLIECIWVAGIWTVLYFAEYAVFHR